jgi:anthranilate phosphoribosyltransferase
MKPFGIWWLAMIGDKAVDLIDFLCDDSRDVALRVEEMARISEREISSGFLAEVASVLLSRAVPLPKLEAIDVCGTGGDAAAFKTFNVSTASAFVLAACGVPVAKHGNRAISSQCGSSDVLAVLGIKVVADAREAEDQFNKHRLVFLHAPCFHPVLAQIAPIRKAFGKPTFFNLLGPLLNPAKVERQLIGVYDEKYTSIVAEAAALLGKKKIWVVHSKDGLDEVSLCAPTIVFEMDNGKTTRFEITPEDCGLRRAYPTDIAGGDADNNVAIIEDILKGSEGARADLVVLNVAAGLIVAEKAADLNRGVMMTREVLKSGAAHRKLEEMRGK